MHKIPRSFPSLVIAALVALGCASTVEAQSGTVIGRVVDAATLEPLASVQVSIPELGIGVLTEQAGRFTLVDVPAGPHTVEVQRIGYRETSAEVTVVADQSVEQQFAIEQEALALNEIIVTGTPGGTQRRAIGNVVSRLDAEEITTERPVSTMQDLLSSRTPGLDFVRVNGNIGTGSQIRIRGVSSLSLGSQPLIYVDGVRVDNSTRKGPDMSGQGSASSALDDINPNDIASIEIIKGPAAATLYGTEASAGVIQILTKKGEAGAPQFSLNMTQGSNFLTDPAGRIGDQYWLDQEGGLHSFNLYEVEKERGNEVFQHGLSHGYGLSVRGGSEAIRYFVSGDWDDETGILDYNTNERMSVRANVGVLITPELNFNVSTGFISGNTRYAEGTHTTGDVWDNLQWAQGALLERRTRGFLTYTPEDFSMIEATRDYKRFTGSATITFTPMEWLTQRLVVGTDYASDENVILIPRVPEGDEGPFRALNLGDIEVERPLNNQYTLDYSASATYSLMDVGLTSSVGAQYYTEERNSISTHGSIFPSPAIRSIGGATNKVVTSNPFVQNKSLGFFVQQEANIRDRVYLTGAVRMDDNSAFGAEYDAAIYPKVSAAWVISDEPFFARFQNVIGSMRLRTAWGMAGRQPDAFAAVTLYGAAVGPGGAAAVTPDEVGNPEIGPEVSSELEVGFEAAMLDDRVVTDFTYYYQRVRDALGSIPLPSSWGFPGSKDGNIGRLDNWGWELTLDLGLLRRPDFAFDIGVIGSHTKNKIVDLGPRAPTNDTREGLPYPVYTSTIIRSANFDENGQVVNPMCDAGTGYMGLEPGGPAVPCAETEDYELLLGTRYPQYTWALTPRLTLFDDLEIFALLDAEFGRWGADYGAYCRHTLCGLTNSRKGLLRDDAVYVEGVIRQDRHPVDQTKYIYYNADHAKLRELGARYRLPSSLLEMAGVNSASISISGRNLLMLWQKQKEISGVNIADVEMTSRSGGGGLFQWPGLSSVAAELRVTF